MDFFSFQERIKKPAGDAAASAGAKKTPREVLTVSQLTSQIERSIKKTFPSSLEVQGEVSNLRRAQSGHLYFSLKDPHNCIECVMWASDADGLKFEPDDGMELVVAGRVGIYGPQSRYQIQVTRLTPLGQGALELAFRQLCEKLKQEGLFETERKKPLPAHPSRIALVTSREGAAVQDMLKVLRRFPWLKLMIYHVPVQGDGAAERIALAIGEINRSAARLGGVDVILLGRGGGSLEDLWGFNEEMVARAIVASKIPIITGIGHEVDVTIADLAADYHAHTPTEAAQVATANWRNARGTLEAAEIRLRREMRTKLEECRRRLMSVERHEIFRRPLERIQQARQRLDDRQRALVMVIGNRLRLWGQRLGKMGSRLQERHPRHALALLRQRCDVIGQRMTRGMEQLILRRRGRMEALTGQLRALAPTEVLRRGYSITTIKKSGIILRSTAQVKAGDRLITRVADGTSESIVRDTRQMSLFE
jgi:exodeoxyribonuclease VII large subunit